MKNKQPHILVVDDHADFRTSITRLLTVEGFEVSCAASGDEALALLENQDFADDIDLLLLDYRMPGRNGGQTLTELRARGFDTPALLLSSTPGIDVLCKLFGFDAALAKPCDFEDLLTAIQRCLEATRLVARPPAKKRLYAVTG